MHRAIDLAHRREPDATGSRAPALRRSAHQGRGARPAPGAGAQLGLARSRGRPERRDPRGRRHLAPGRRARRARAARHRPAERGRPDAELPRSGPAGAGRGTAQLRAVRSHDHRHEPGRTGRRDRVRGHLPAPGRHRRLRQGRGAALGGRRTGGRAPADHGHALGRSSRERRPPRGRCSSRPWTVCCRSRTGYDARRDRGDGAPSARGDRPGGGSRVDQARRRLPRSARPRLDGHAQLRDHAARRARGRDPRGGLPEARHARRLCRVRAVGHCRAPARPTTA